MEIEEDFRGFACVLRVLKLDIVDLRLKNCCWFDFGGELGVLIGCLGLCDS